MSEPDCRRSSWLVWLDRLPISTQIESEEPRKSALAGPDEIGRMPIPALLLNPPDPVSVCECGLRTCGHFRLSHRPRKVFRNGVFGRLSPRKTSPGGDHAEGVLIYAAIAGRTHRGREEQRRPWSTLRISWRRDRCTQTKSPRGSALQSSTSSAVLPVPAEDGSLPSIFSMR